MIMFCVCECVCVEKMEKNKIYKKKKNVPCVTHIKKEYVKAIQLDSLLFSYNSSFWKILISMVSLIKSLIHYRILKIKSNLDKRMMKQICDFPMKRKRVAWTFRKMKKKKKLKNF